MDIRWTLDGHYKFTVNSRAPENKKIMSIWNSFAAIAQHLIIWYFIVSIECPSSVHRVSIECPSSIHRVFTMCLGSVCHSRYRHKPPVRSRTGLALQSYYPTYIRKSVGHLESALILTVSGKVFAPPCGCFHTFACHSPPTPPYFNIDRLGTFET